MGRKKLGMFQIRFKVMDRLLLVGILVLVIVTMVLFGAFATKAEKNQVDFVQMMMEKTSLYQREQFESFINDRINTLKVLATYPEIYEMDKERQSEFIRYRSGSFGFRHIFVMDMQGMGFYIEEGIVRNQGWERFFTDVKDNEIYITEPFYGEDGTTAIMTACVSIYDENGTKVGALCGAINLRAVQEVITNNEMLLGDDCFIVDKSGAFVTPPSSAYIGGDVSMYDRKNSEMSLIQQAFLWEDHRGGIVVIDGREYVAHVCYLPDYTWAIVHCTPMEEIVKQYDNLSILQKVLIAAIAVLVFCIARIIYCWYISINETYKDALTGLNNRAACSKMLSYLEKKQEAVSIFFMDLNKFKFVNDTYGHEKGDVLLKIFSASLMETFGKIGFVCRMGGDEFVTILLNSSESEISAVWQQLCERLAAENSKLDFDYVISSSYGVATRQKGEQVSLEELMQLADERMYEYKQAHKMERN